MSVPSLLDAALSYAARGWRVHPLHAPTITEKGARCSCARGYGCPDKQKGKHPRLGEWPDQATTDADTIRAWWTKWPKANIGIVTGPGSGLAVLDIDPRNGGHLTLEALVHQHGPLPETPIVLSGGGGQHYDFVLTEDLPSIKLDGIDFLTAGHYVLAPPSLHPSGKRYTWEVSSEPDDTPLAEIPAWLRALIETTVQDYTVAASTLPDNLPVVDLEQLKLSTTMKTVIITGNKRKDPYTSRSEALFAVETSMVRAGYDDATMAAVLLDPQYGISDKPLHQKDPRAAQYWILTKGWLAKDIARARAKVAADDAKQAQARAAPKMWRANGAAAADEPAPPEAESTHAEKPLPRSDTTNAMALVETYGTTLHYCFPWKQWFLWNDSHWSPDQEGAVMQRASHTIRAMFRQLESLHDPKDADASYRHIKSSLNTSRLKAMVENAQSHPGIPVLPEALDQHHWLLNCANGTLDLRTGILQPHRREDLLTKCLDIAYDPDATCPIWERFVWHIMGGSGDHQDDPDGIAQGHEARFAADERARRLVGFLQRAVGYSLTGDTSEHCFFLLYGTGRNGKGTLIETVQAMLGPYGKTAEMSTFLARQTETVRNDLADLHGARFVSASEADKGKRLAESLVKRLTGGDRIKARFLFQEYFEFLPQMHVWLAVNDKPVIRGTDLAMWERIRLIPFEVFIPPAARDRHLGQKLRAELPGILAWAVQGCLEWQRYDGLKEPAEVTQATEAYRQEMDVLGRFLDECCTIGPAVRVKAGTLYKAYQTWCANNGYQADSMTEIGYRLDTMQFQKKESHGMWRLGIGLNSADGE